MTPRSETPKDEGPWAWQARDAVAGAGKLGINAFAIYCALTHFQSAAGIEHKRRFSASYEQISALVGCGKNTVARCLPQLQKAGLVRIFSGSNKSRRATRNAFFLATISTPSQGHGTPSQGQHVKPPQGHDVKPSQGRLEKKKNNYAAPPQAAAGVVEKNEEEGSARSRLGRSGGPSKKPEHGMRALTQDELDRANQIAEMTKDL